MYDTIKKETAIKWCNMELAQKILLIVLECHTRQFASGFGKIRKRIWKQKSKQKIRKAGTQTGTPVRPAYTVRARVIGTTV